MGYNKSLSDVKYTLKTCIRCTKKKNLEQFTLDKRNKDGHTSLCRECESLRHKEMRKNHWEKILAHYGKKCTCCGIDEKIFLTVDHIKGDGSKHRKNLNRGRLYAYIVRENFPKDYQILCWNCNCAKKNNGFCPHQKNLLNPRA